MRQDGERAFLTYLGHQASYALSKDQRQLLEQVKGEDIVHFSGYFMQPKLRPQIHQMIKAVNRRGARISFDPGWDSDGFRSKTRSEVNNILGLVDFFEPNQTELTAAAGLKSVRGSVRRVSRYFDGILAVKMGDGGSRIFAGGELVVKADAFQVRSVIDSTGAGDVFDGAFLHLIGHNKSLIQCARYGNAAASLYLSSHRFGIRRFPSKLQVDHLIGR